MAYNSSTVLEHRRQRRIDRRRQEIMAAAARIFAEQGYVTTTTKAIAEAADMAEGTLYNYFNGKRDILLSILDQTRAPVENLLAEVGYLDQREDLVLLVERIFDMLLTHLSFTQTLVREAWMDDEILQEFFVKRLGRIAHYIQTYIQERVHNGMFRPVDPVMTTQIIMGMFAAGIVPVLRGITPPPGVEARRAWAEAAVALVFDGLRVREG